MGIVPSERIRNVAVLGHGGTGKSTLVEALLRVAGAVGPSPGQGLISDADPEERERGHSLGLAVASFEYEGYKINLLDTPGRAEAIGDAYPALAAADTALFVVDATVGVQAQHEELWEQCEARDIPRLVFLNKLDLPAARYQTVVDDLRERVGKRLAPVHMPIGQGEQFTGVVDLLHDNAVEFHDGVRVEEQVPEALRDQVAHNRESLVEALVENDDDLLVEYLDGMVPGVAELADVFAHGIAACGFFPVLVGEADKGIGIELLLHFLVEECPSPRDRPHSIDQNRQVTACVVKTFSDQYVGRINVLRLLAGTLQTDDSLVNHRTGVTHRLHQLFSLVGRQQVPVSGAGPGDVVGVSKLDDVATGDVLFAGSDPGDIDVPMPPEGYHRVVLQPVSASDDDKLSAALRRMIAEDPSIRSVVDLDSGEHVLHFYGPTHVAVTIQRLERLFGIHVADVPAPVAYRQTVRSATSGVGRHVKQSGGHGQFGVAHIELSPRPRGEGFSFTDAIVGGVIPSNYIHSVEKGVREAMRSGPLGDFPVVDIAVRLVDGKHHSVDSSDAAFQMAGILAFRDAMAHAEAVLLEPLMELDVVVPESLTGAVMSDLSARRGRIMGTDVVAGGWSRIRSEVPEVELGMFAAEFRSLTSGRGRFAMRYSHHEEVPPPIARRLLADVEGEPADAR